MRIISWNINGYKARKHELQQLLVDQAPDICCIVETKSKPIKDHFDGYQLIQNNGTNGKNGVAILVKLSSAKSIKHMLPADQFGCGRIIVIFLDQLDPMMFLYVPNAGRKLKTLKYRLQWNKYLEQCMQDIGRPIMLVAGDLNVVHTDQDIHNIKGRERLAGCTEEEKEDHNHLIQRFNLIDTFRQLHPIDRKYTFWSYMGTAKQRNKGWRLDYILANNNIKDNIINSGMIDTTTGSDHCPIYCDISI